MNLSSVGGWQGNVLNYVLFEKDSWPTGIKFTSIDNNGAIGTYQYRSADAFYDKGKILFWDPNPALHMGSYARDISGQIKFNSRL